MSSAKDAAARTGRAALPSMTALLEAADKDVRFRTTPRTVLTDALRATLEEIRRQLEGGAAAGDRGGADAAAMNALLDAAARRIEARGLERFQSVINATGVVLHTNLGRAPLAAEAVAALAETAGGYNNLEFDLVSGERGRRGAALERLLRELTGCEAALVVNNNAAATMLVLATLAAGREVIVSRGQLIEIGGSYRLPDVMQAGGAILREVGTTNKTRLADYADAIGERTGLLMRVHTSNYRIVGFAESPGAAELATLAQQHGLPFFDDLGSGALCDDRLWQAADEPTVAASLRAGADVVSFSGDKLLGGPQAGIIVGRRETVERCRKHPMARALRIGRLTIAALQATLELYHDPARAATAIPAQRMLRADIAGLRARAERLAAALRAACPGEAFEVREESSYAGGGSLPAWPLPTAVVRWRPARVSPRDAADGLRLGRPAVIVRLADEAVLIDVRTLSEADEAFVVAAVSGIRG